MNQDSIQFITNHYGNLTKNEKIVADYIITHFNESIHMSVHELAQKSGVSVATLIRLSQHLGFNGYKEFRLFLAQRHPKHEDLILDISQTVSTVENSVEKVLNSEMDSIRLTLEKIDYSVLTHISNRLKQADHLLFFGTGTSQLVCQDASLKFQRAGLLSHSTDDVNTAAVFLSSFTNNDVIVIISHSGENINACKIAKLAKQIGVYVVAVTTFDKSPITMDADIVLQTQTRESPVHKIAFTSRISQLVSMDALFMTYFTMNHNECKKNIDMISANLHQVW